MGFSTENLDSDCPSHDIASYIDGELDADREIEIEAHLSVCGICTEDLNHQKHFLNTLNSSLRNEKEIDLPADFAKSIVANAESTVSGLRRPRERFNALFICAAMLLFVLFALGADAGSFFDKTSGVVDQIAAVGGFFGHIIYSFFLGVTIVLRSVAALLRFDAIAGLMLAGFAAISLMLISRKVLRMRRI